MVIQPTELRIRLCFCSLRILKSYGILPNPPTLHPFIVRILRLLHEPGLWICFLGITTLFFILSDPLALRPSRV